MSDAVDKALDTITEAEALPFITELRSDLSTANAALVTAQAALSDANQSIATSDAKVASLTASLATAEASLTAAQAELDSASHETVVSVPAKIQVILHQMNGNRLLTTLSTDAPESGTLTVHVS
jgi:capsule polysaccharide export protein KpsE/RkpR